MFTKQSIDDQARALQKLLNESGWNSDASLLSKRILELNQGLVQEDEFIYILNWMNKVVLMHKLDQFHIPPSAKEHYTIPDLYLVIDNKGQKQPYYIEIKTSKKHALSWTEKYYNGLKNYSQDSGIPVLIAWKWKRFDIWTVFKLEDFEQKTKGGNYKIDLNRAHTRSLFSQLFGDYFISIPELLSIIIKHRKIKKQAGESGVLWETLIDSIYFTDREGNPVAIGNMGVTALFYCLTLEEIIEEDDSFIYYKLTPSPNKNIFAQSIPIALSEIFSDEIVNWTDKIRNQIFPLTYNDLLIDLNKAFDEGTMQNIFYFEPNST